jgi:predicted adenine nucleotide alpha hydrolase (AANH) superfamily ATPase
MISAIPIKITIFFQNPNIIPTDRKISLKIYMEIQKILSSQSNSEQNAQCQSCHNSQFQTTLQGHNNKKAQY